MTLAGKRVLLTGASSGIGRETALLLGRKGARLALAALDREGLDSVSAEIRSGGGEVVTYPLDLTRPEAVESVAAGTLDALGAVDILVNNAGRNSFTPYSDEAPASIEASLRVNLLAPMLLTRRLLPHFLERQEGRIVNVGSVFGSIGFPYFTTYSVTKFGVRGFSEALRRELRGTGVTVVYVAPRATRTPMNSAFEEAAAAARMSMDDPVVVAAKIVRAIEKGRRCRTIGLPERFFVRVNSLLPGLVDRALGKQRDKLKPYAVKGIRK